VDRSVFQPVADSALIVFRQERQLDRPYLLTVATSAKRKNISGLLDAYRIFKSRKSFPLVIVAGSPYAEEEIIRLVRERELEDFVKVFSEIGKTEMARFYRAARVFVFPSLYEGFGLPVLEAMACGCPVITSNVSSLPEVAGGAAYLVNPEEPEDIAAAMEAVVSDDTLRADLIQKGLKRAGEFSWEQCVREHMRVYGQVAGQVS